MAEAMYIRYLFTTLETGTKLIFPQFHLDLNGSR